MFTLFFGLLLISGWLFATLTGKDVWPFSAYPMFSDIPKGEQLNFFRIRLETKNGQSEWWNPEVKQIARNFDSNFRRVWKKSILQKEADPKAFTEGFVGEWVKPDSTKVSAILVIGRTVQKNDASWESHDQQLLRIELPQG